MRAAAKAAIPLARGAGRDARIRAKLLSWYRAHARDLPWRRTRDPYLIWLSEVMLQQTRVDTVIPYFERFTREFPSVAALARASLDDVLRMWSGLGYYSRARNLHLAANRIVGELGGRFPTSAAELALLPGIGRYTAAAVASIAFGEPVAVLDGNVKRVLARIDACQSPIDEPATEAALWRRVTELLDARCAGDFNQALMELGAMVCTPRAPNCAGCPIRSACLAKKRGEQLQLPRKRGTKPPIAVHAVAAAIVRSGRVLLVRRPARGLLGGLWGFPSGDLHGEQSETQALRRIAREMLGVSPRSPRHIGTVRHVFTHRALTLEVYRADLARGARVAMAAGGAKRESDVRWFDPTAPAGVGLSALDRKALRLLNSDATRR